MTTITIPATRLGRAVRESVIDQLAGAGMEQVLVSQARARIDRAGDSTHKYPDLWATRTGRGYRAGGQPLRDNGPLYNLLHATEQRSDDSLRLTLKDGSGYGAPHQEGFTTRGPNFIPLTLHARRTHRKGANPKEEGLVEGTDYIMVWKGVTVPQRKIFNLPPEDLDELRQTVTLVIGGALGG